jgi:dipeptidyl aminopeptidase/acylaminoacyl peptidase
VEVSYDDGDAEQFVKGVEWERHARTSGGVLRSKHHPSAKVHMVIHEDLNTPPKLYARGRNVNRESLVLDVNPQLKESFLFGNVRFIEWSDLEGRIWSGRLYYPARYRPANRYPLVIQTNGVASKNEFSLYGREPNLGPGWAAYGAQALAGREIAVLQVEEPSLPEVPLTDQLTRVKKIIAGYAAAIEYLSRTGLIDRENVGLMGFSATGWYVEYALAHSPVNYAAAIVSDNKDAGYFQEGLAGWESPLAADRLNGSSPFGPGLQQWLQESPSFNVERINAPLMIQISNSHGGVGALLVGWEMFSRLRHLNKAAELFIAPDIYRGSHNLQNPSQLVAVQERAMDWWQFWLANEADADPRKANQYKLWRDLREQTSRHRSALLHPTTNPRLDVKMQ